MRREETKTTNLGADTYDPHTTSTELQTGIHKALEDKGINPRTYEEILPEKIWQNFNKHPIIYK